MKRNWKSLMVSGTVLTVLAGALTLPALASVGQRTAALHYQNIKVTLDGRTLDLTDSRGNEVEPFTIDRTTYLPLASISKALGMDVRWDADTNTVILNTKGTGTTAAESYIGVERAKEIALKDAGLSASQVSFVRAGLDWDNGRMGTRWSSGRTTWSTTMRSTPTPAPSSTATGTSRGTASPPSPPPTSAPTVPRRSRWTTPVCPPPRPPLCGPIWTMRTDAGCTMWSFYSGSKEYDYEIDAASGDILSWDYDAEYYTGQAAGQTGSYLSEAEVRQIVEDRAGVSGTFRELHLDRDDGRVVYEGEMRDGWTEYEFTLDAVTGTILEWDVDRH